MRPFFGWRVVATAFVLAIFSWGISFYGPPIFLEYLHANRGWSIASVSGAITAHFLLGAAVVANLARLHRRFGLVATTRAGAVASALGLLGWAVAAAPWHLYLAAPLSGAGWAMTSGAALNAMIAPWFVRRRPAALGMAFNGASMGGVIFSPAWVALIAAFGFPGAAGLVAMLFVVTIWLLSGRYLGRDPAAMGLAPDGIDAAPAAAKPLAADAMKLASPWRDQRLLTLAAASACGLVAQIGLVAHLFSILTPRLGEAVAGLTMGGATACAILGRLVLGAIMPANADRRRVAAANAAMQAAGSVVLLGAGSNTPLLLLGCALFGLGLGNVTSLPPLVAQAEFRPADIGRVVAMVTATGQAAYAFAPAAFALLRDAGGSTLLFGAAMLLQLLSAALALLGRASVRATALKNV